MWSGVAKTGTFACGEVAWVLSLSLAHGVASMGRRRDSIVRSMLTAMSVTRLVCESGVGANNGGGAVMRTGVEFGTYSKDVSHFVGVGTFGSRTMKGDDMFSLTEN